MSIIDSDILAHQRAALIDRLEHLERPDLPDVLSDVPDMLGDVVSTVVVTGEHGITKVIRTVRRHPRGSGMTAAAIVLLVAAVMWWKRRPCDEATKLSVADAA